MSMSQTWSYTRTHILDILCHDICILAIPKVRTRLSDVVTRLNRTRTHNFQAYSHWAFIYTFSYNSF
ncbi:hypothetical protein F383_14342 [Gossypium arboreum]|uniref:Uncharacterized protein n=1 Tax=Gossypium arboreum TaxID=29729 RepID=A0A0B0PX37_GOSAR|nr:hypothetical protein F383_14342 [Gossypium arboreum]